MRALIIETDYHIVRDLVVCLKLRYPNLEYVSTDEAEKGIEQVASNTPDFVIQGTGHLGLETETTLERIRRFSDVPIILLSKNDEPSDRARFLEAGADDYISSPINCFECLSVINAVLRRTLNLGFKPEERFNIDQRLTLDLATRELMLSGKPVHLTPTEYSLLSVLVRNSGAVISHSTLLEKVWGSNYSSDIVLLKKYIHYLRSKIEQDPKNPRIIKSERGLGYKLIKQLSLVVMGFTSYHQLFDSILV